MANPAECIQIVEQNLIPRLPALEFILQFFASKLSLILAVIAGNVGSMKRAGLRGNVCIPRYKITRRAETPDKPRNPACFMTACCTLCLF
jgi:hypothetical protein